MSATGLTLYTALDDVRTLRDTLDSLDSALAPQEEGEELAVGVEELELQLAEAVKTALKKGDSFIGYMRQLEGFSMVAKSEAKRLADAAKRAENRYERLLDYAKAAMENSGDKKLVFPLGTLSIKNNPPSVLITDAAAVPPEYKTIIPATEQISKTALARVLKTNAAIPGADLLPGGTRLEIK